MGDLFKALSSGFARFVFAWLGPSVLTLGIFCLFVLPAIENTWLLGPVTIPAKESGITAALIFVLFATILSVLFAYSSLPIYRLLEGYSLPKVLRRRLMVRQLREWHRLNGLARRYRVTGQLGSNVDFELIESYPQERSEVQATRLGNALRAMETFGLTRYGLDSQRLWYELQGVVPEGTKRDTEEGRVPVDFFVSSIAHLSLLAVVCSVTAVAEQDVRILVIGLLAAALVPLAYRGAVRNMKDWAYSVKALVNLGRLDLAKRLGLEMPRKLDEEQNMWNTYNFTIEQGDMRFVDFFNEYRSANPRRVKSSG